MSDYIVTSNGLLPADELMHYAKGQTKKNAKYVSRKKVNGKWVYTYKQNEHDDNMRSIKIAQEEAQKESDYSRDLLQQKTTTRNIEEQGFPSSYDDWKKMEAADRKEAKAAHARSNRYASEIESRKRQSVSAQRNVQKSWSYKLGAKKAYYVNKAKNYWKKLTTKYKYRKISIHGSVSVGGNTSSFDTNFYSDKHGNPVNLGKNFIKKYGL